MSKDKLTEEELRNRLRLWFDSYRYDCGILPIDEQAYAQLKEIVKWHFDNGIAQIVGDLKKTEGWDIKIIDHPDIPFMKEVGQQKPTVTREKLRTLWSMIQFAPEYKIFERIVVNDLGVEVTK